MGINEKRGKRILILGNGFDLAHNLPTKYSDFLKFCKIVKSFFDNNNDIFGYIEYICAHKEDSESEIVKSNKTIEFKEQFITKLNGEGFKNTKIIEDDFDIEMNKFYQGEEDNFYLSNIYEYIRFNIWFDYLEYLYTNSMMKGENWIDFETEICYVIKEIDQMNLSLTDEWKVLSKNIDNLMSDKLFHFAILFDNKFDNPQDISKRRRQFTMREFINKLYSDLERLICALELYLSDFVEKIEIEIEKLNPEIERINPDYIINFNYTHTYEKNYEKIVKETNEKNKENSKVYHIHGEAKLNRDKNNDSNIVLGIDEYWSDEEKDKHTNFTIFKKFAQRIQKKTGDNIYRYLEEIKGIGSNINRNINMSDDENNNYVSEVYVFGHSLDITDKDIISEFIGNDATSVRIFCRSKQSEGELIAKTINLIGEDKLIEKTYRKIANLEYIILNNNE